MKILNRTFLYKIWLTSMKILILYKAHLPPNPLTVTLNWNLRDKQALILKGKLLFFSRRWKNDWSSIMLDYLWRFSPIQGNIHSILSHQPSWNRKYPNNNLVNIIKRVFSVKSSISSNPFLWVENFEKRNSNNTFFNIIFENISSQYQIEKFIWNSIINIFL